MNPTPKQTLEDFQATAMSTLVAAAAHAIDVGLYVARQDDPHQLATVHKRFKDGKAAQRLVLEYLPGDRVGVTMVLAGPPAEAADDDGEPLVVQVFHYLMAKTAQH